MAFDGTGNGGRGDSSNEACEDAFDKMALNVAIIGLLEKTPALGSIRGFELKGPSVGTEDRGRCDSSNEACEDAFDKMALNVAIIGLLEKTPALGSIRGFELKGPSVGTEDRGRCDSSNEACEDAFDKMSLGVGVGVGDK
jgi:hypothetical protein